MDKRLSGGFCVVLVQVAKMADVEWSALPKCNSTTEWAHNESKELIRRATARNERELS